MHSGFPRSFDSSLPPPHHPTSSALSRSTLTSHSATELFDESQPLPAPIVLAGGPALAPTPSAPHSAAAAAAAAAADRLNRVRMSDSVGREVDALERLTASLIANVSNEQPPYQLTTVAQKICESDARLQMSVRKLIEHNRLQTAVDTATAELNEHNASIVAFAEGLSQIEQKLYDALNATTEQSTNRDVDGRDTHQSFSVTHVLTFAERIGLMSFAPTEYIERKGLTLSRPPAPLEEAMALSRLHLTPTRNASAERSPLSVWVPQCRSTVR